MMIENFSRRFFLKIMSYVSGILWFFHTKNIIFAEENQDTCDLKAVEDPLVWPDEKIAFWVMGCYIPDSELTSQGTLSILLRHEQGYKNEFVDKVVLSDHEKNLISARYFSLSDKIEGGGYPPYMIFDGLDLKNFIAPLSLTIQIRNSENQTLKRYRYTFTKAQLKPTSLTQDYLPMALREDLKKSHNGGKISGFYQFQESLNFDRFYLHTVRAYLSELRADGGFRLEIRFFHPEEAQSQDHYNRYFFATDPVGRILGIKKRSFNDGLIESCSLTHLSEDERNQWLLTTDNVARLWDCPYIMVFTEDIKEALACGIIWLHE